MRKFYAIFLLSVYLCSTTECYQFLKIPLVFVHYAGHLMENRDTGIGVFIQTHFLQKQVKDRDYEQDMQLPFKRTCKHIFTAISSYVPMLKPCVPKPLDPVVALHPETPVTRHFFASSYLAKIWQPPRHC